MLLVLPCNLDNRIYCRERTLTRIRRSYQQKWEAFQLLWEAMGLVFILNCYRAIYQQDSGLTKAWQSSVWTVRPVPFGSWQFFGNIV